MTSFIIDAHSNRELPPEWKLDGECPFCRIISKEDPAYRLYEDDTVVAFLDILPLRPGHTLIVPKVHVSRVSELPSEYAAALGKAVTTVSAALTRAVNNTALNVVCNQEYAQAVHHVHYHIIPAPNLSNASESNRARRAPESVTDMHRREIEARSELDDADAHRLVHEIKAHL